MTMTTSADCEHEFKLDVADRGADRRRPVGQDGHLHRGGQGALQLRQELLDAVGDFNDVRARLPLDIHQHGRVSFIQAACLTFSTSSATSATSEMCTGPPLR